MSCDDPFVFAFFLWYADRRAFERKFGVSSGRIITYVVHHSFRMHMLEKVTYMCVWGGETLNFLFFFFSLSLVCGNVYWPSTYEARRNVLISTAESTVDSSVIPQKKFTKLFV